MPWQLYHVPDRFKTQEMCNEAMYRGPWHLKYVPDWCVTEQQLKLWYDYNDSECCDDDDKITFQVV